MESAISKIKQPEPKISDAKAQTLDIEGKKYKVINANRNIGVVSAPKTSRTPIRDWVEIKRQENPYTIYKIKTEKPYKDIFSMLTGAAVALCGVVSLFKLIKK